MQNFFQKKDKNDSDVFSVIEHACEGLIYISETDAPLLPFTGRQSDVVTPENILQQSHIPAETNIEERNFDEFFEKLTTVRDWYGEKEIDRAKKFLELKTLLEENLRDLKVFRFGTIRLDIFVVGIDKEGYLAGFATKAVET